jgi:hypothetical protein
MRGTLRSILIFIGFLTMTLLGVLAYVRLAPSDPAVWNTDPRESYSFASDAPSGEVVALLGAAALQIEAADPAETLRRLDSIALDTPGTQRLAGSPEEGRITWITRSKLWGFPDYTTAEAGPDGVFVFARLRFGKSDLGVNAARLTAWLAELRARPSS